MLHNYNRRPRLHGRVMSRQGWVIYRRRRTELVGEEDRVPLLTSYETNLKDNLTGQKRNNYRQGLD